MKHGYTTGVFDLFHVGHLRLLKRAAQSCDFLTVGVTSDELATSVKGISPTIPYSERLEIVESIDVVDRAVEQSSYDKLAAWKNLRFDVMFVGDDWKGTPQWNEYESIFEARGVEIIYLPYTLHTSSTLLRDLVKRANEI